MVFTVPTSVIYPLEWWGHVQVKSCVGVLELAPVWEKACIIHEHTEALAETQYHCRVQTERFVNLGSHCMQRPKPTLCCVNKVKGHVQL